MGTQEQLTATHAPMSDAVAAFEQHRADVHGWALRLLGHHHDAADVTQDVCIRWLVRCQIDPAAPARPWLRRVTINRAIDLLRARRSQRNVDRAATNRFHAAGSGSVEGDELRAAVAEALSQLSDMQRCVLVAKALDGRTFAQIAAELEVAIPTAKTHYFRALTALRAVLGDLQHASGR